MLSSPRLRSRANLRRMLNWWSVGRISCALWLCASVFVACGSDSAKKVSKADAEAGQGGGGQPGNVITPGGEAMGGNAQGGDAGVIGPNDLGFLNQFCVDYSEKLCTEREACYGTDAGCRRNETEFCHEYGRAELLPALAAGALTYHADRAAECFAAKVDGFCSANNLWMVPECSAIFTGTAVGDDPCYQVYFLGQTFPSCDGGACSAKPQTACGSGRCTQFLAEGATCRDAMNVQIEPGCDAGLICNQTTKKCTVAKARHETCTTPGELCGTTVPMVTCVPRADGAPGYECDSGRAAGQPCGETDGPQFSAACASLVCRNNVCADKDELGAQYCFSPATPCPAGQACLQGADNPVCGTPIANGNACHADRECADGLVCVNDGDAQDPTAGTCGAPAKSGESCLALPCGPDLRCIANGDASTCTPIGQPGDACTGTGQSSCAEGLYCLKATGKCSLRLLFGEMCEDDRDCEGGLYCNADNGRCAPWKANGAACTRDQECVYYNACMDGKCVSQICTL